MAERYFGPGGLLALGALALMLYDRSRNRPAYPPGIPPDKPGWTSWRQRPDGTWTRWHTVTGTQEVYDPLGGASELLPENIAALPPGPPGLGAYLRPWWRAIAARRLPRPGLFPLR